MLVKCADGTFVNSAAVEKVEILSRNAAGLREYKLLASDGRCIGVTDRERFDPRSMSPIVKAAQAAWVVEYDPFAPVIADTVRGLARHIVGWRCLANGTSSPVWRGGFRPHRFHYRFTEPSYRGLECYELDLGANGPGDAADQFRKLIGKDGKEAQLRAYWESRIPADER